MTTLSEYAAAVTEIMDGGPGSPNPASYPDDFDAQVETCFQQRLTVEQAAEKIAAE